jgi:hypothetical protein
MSSGGYRSCMGEPNELDPSQQPSEWLAGRSDHELEVLQAPDTSMATMHDAMNMGADAEFHRQHPDAPETLDAHDPAQAQWRQEWLESRDQVANKLTDNEFYARDAVAGGHAGERDFKLDPSDHSPGNEAQMDHWKDLHNEIVHGAPAEQSYQPGEQNWAVPPAILDPDPMDPHINVTPDTDIDPNIYYDPDNASDTPIDT